MVAHTQEPQVESLDLEEQDGLKEHRRQVLRKRKERMEKKEPSLVRDILGWVVILSSLAFLLMLSSFDPSDPSYFNETSKHKADNLLGLIGANIAALTIELFGFCSYLFPFVMGYAGFLCIRPRKVHDLVFQFIGIGVITLLFLVFLGSFPTVILRGQPIQPGGFFGVQMWTFLSGYLNPFGTYLLLIGVVGLIVLIATQLSLHDIFQALQRFGLWFWSKILWVVDRVRERYEAARKLRRQHAIIRRELDKMNDGERVPTPEPVERYPRGEDLVSREIEPEFPIDEPGMMQSLDLDESEDDGPPSPPQRRPHAGGSIQINETVGSASRSAPPPAANGVKVNQPKPAQASQEAFQFINEMEEEWVFPNSSFFMPSREEHKIDEKELREKAGALSEKFAEFSVTGEMKEIHPGPVVTTYEFRPDAGIKYSKIVNLQDDLCLALGAESIRIDRMQGRSSVGLEVPNSKRELITFREMIESKEFTKDKTKLLVTLGKTIDGTSYFTDLAKMPHLLIAGQTGSGKSVGLNAMICSILMRVSPDEAKLILIDPKMVEMGIYADIPHLLTPVVTDPEQASNSLKWAVAEMEERYKLLAANSVRNLDQYNSAIKNGRIHVAEGEEPPKPKPYIVVIIDELADLMMVARGEVEESIARIAQKSRAVGIHLILATQRPSVDIITGVIKSNLPSRLSYRVAQRNDSRIILDANGAERLLGKGDGLFLGPGTSRLVRIHAPFLSESEVLDLVNFLKRQGKPDYDHAVLRSAATDDGELREGGGSDRSNDDPMYEKAARLVVRSGQASVSYLQRKLSLGYARAAKLIDLMEDDGIVGPNVGSKARDILVPADYFDGVDGQAR